MALPHRQLAPHVEQAVHPLCLSLGCAFIPNPAKKPCRSKATKGGVGAPRVFAPVEKPSRCQYGESIATPNLPLRFPWPCPKGANPLGRSRIGRETIWVAIVLFGEVVPLLSFEGNPKGKPMPVLGVQQQRHTHLAIQIVSTTTRSVQPAFFLFALKSSGNQPQCHCERWPNPSSCFFMIFVPWKHERICPVVKSNPFKTNRGKPPNSSLCRSKLGYP